MDLTAWTSTLLGFYILFAGIGALRNPASWQKMIGEVGKSPALQLVAGLLELVVGALVYLANPWVPADLLSCVLKTAGGLLMIEALVIAGFADIYTHFWLRTLNHMHRGWAIFTILVGLILAVVGMLRFG
jgi:uncharacterized protein YjeT (DUF2065 family)